MDSLVCGLPSNMWLPCPEYIHLNNELLSVLDIVNGVPSIYGCHDGNVQRTSVSNSEQMNESEYNSEMI